MAETYTVLSVRNPWPWLIFNGGKSIENRHAITSYRGRLLIHASARSTYDEWTQARLFVAQFDRALSERIPLPSELVHGAIIGEVTLANVFRYYQSPWFTGPVGYLLEDAKLWPEPVKASGQLGLWKWSRP